MKVTKIKAPSKGKIDTYFIAGDWHSDALHKSSLNIMIKMAMKLPKSKRKLIINGDFLDCPHLMPRNPLYQKYIKSADGIEEYFLPLSEDEFTWGNEVLDRLQKVFKEIIFIEGNHDWRYRDFMKVAPSAYAHNFDYIKQLNLKNRGISVVLYNNWLDIGKNLTVTHGAYHGSTCHKKHYEAGGGKSVIFSHIHYIGTKSFSVRGDSVHVWSLPAMCELNPGYIKNRETNWSNGFGVINMRSDSKFHFNVFQVIGGVLVDNLGNTYR